MLRLNICLKISGHAEFAKIALDIPKTGDYHFKCMKEAQE